MHPSVHLLHELSFSRPDQQLPDDPDCAECHTYRPAEDRHRQRHRHGVLELSIDGGGYGRGALSVELSRVLVVLDPGVHRHGDGATGGRQQGTKDDKKPRTSAVTAATTGDISRPRGLLKINDHTNYCIYVFVFKCDAHATSNVSLV